MKSRNVDLVTRIAEKNDAKLKYDFMPAAIEFIEKPVHPAGKVIIYGILLLLIVITVWACCCEIDEVAVMKGTVKCSSDTYKVQAPATGTISFICVKEGDYVKKGSIIAKLASNEYQNIIMQNKKDIDSYNYRITLYKKLINGESLEGVKCPQDILSLVNSENDEYDKSLKLKRQALSEMNTKEQTLLSSKNNLESALKSISTVKKKDERQIESINSSLQETKQQLSSLENQLSNAESELNIFEQQQKTTYLKNITNFQQQINQLKKNQASINEKIQGLTIHAPQSGYIQDISAYKSGNIISAGNDIATIVPQDKEYIIEAFAQNKDIGAITNGQKAQVKVDAYPYQTYGCIDGNVSYIGYDVDSKDSKAADYKVSVKLKKFNSKNRLRQGMTVTAEVCTGKKKIINYVFDPIIKTCDEGFKAR